MRQGDKYMTSFYFFKKDLYEVKASGLQLSFNIFRLLAAWHTTKMNCIKF